ncbi:MAG: hypothetical protein IKU90_06140, partial [Clostridia bacterium]|nr:hypothetical protein [Clostridia bacterium]
VYNSHGKYTFARYNADGNKDIHGDFVITHSPLTAYNQELFASLYVGAGYTLSMMKLEDPIKDANGEFSEYGLVEETRVRTHDENGNELETPEEYQYVPAYYILTDGTNNRYKVIIGDPLVTGGGYYAQYVDLSGETAVKRDAVYVLDTETGLALTAPIEDYVTPILTYPMTMNTYFDVDRFTIGVMKDGKLPGDDDLYEKKITFTYIDLALRENTLQASFPYEFSIDLDGYTPSSNNIDYVLQKMYSPTLNAVKILAPSEKDLAEYGIYAQELNEDGTPKVDEKGNPVYTPFSKYTISFNYDVTDDNGKYLSTINQMILISEKNEEGNYYAYTVISNLVKKNGEEKLEILYTYDMVVEVSGHDLVFLEWEQFEWINSSYINANIAYVTEITLNSPNYNASFILDNSMSNQTETNSSLIQVHGTDSLGNDVTTFSKLQYTDKNGFIWVVTESDIKVYDSTGAERKIAKGESFYDYNVLGSQVLCKTNPINCTDKKVEVTADEVRVIYN